MGGCPEGREQLGGDGKGQLRTASLAFQNKASGRPMARRNKCDKGTARNSEAALHAARARSSWSWTARNYA
eukprot:5187440-Alexandrium_andersonii.AAC.1